jgi:hypothetical protein
VDKIWSRLVSGPAGIFRKFFPKIEPNNPVYGIMDLPGEAEFRLGGLSGGIEFKGSQTGAGKKIYFPHLGGIHQYFLKCIQTALRPDGLGEFCKREPGQVGSIEECFGVAETAVPTQYMELKENFISMADRWSAKCPGDKNNYAKECYNHVVVSAMTAGVNPALALTIWLNESGASNYCEGGTSTKDFGIFDMSIAQNYPEQLKRFLVLPFVSYYQQCQENARKANLDPMYGFLNVFLTGMCDLKRGSQTCSSGASDTDGWAYYTCVRDCTWRWVTNLQCGTTGDCGKSAGSSFGIRGADDILCP